MRNTVFTPFLGAFLPLYSIINYSVTASLQTKLLDIKRVFRDYNRVIKGGLIYANGTNA